MGSNTSPVFDVGYKKSVPVVKVGSKTAPEPYGVKVGSKPVPVVKVGSNYSSWDGIKTCTASSIGICVLLFSPAHPSEQQINHSRKKAMKDATGPFYVFQTPKDHEKVSLPESEKFNEKKITESCT